MAMGLTRVQNKRYTKFKQLQNYFASNAAKVATLQPLADEIADMNLTLAALEGFIPAKSRNSGGVAQTKDELLDTVAGATGDICTRSRAYALKFDANGLASKVIWSMSSIKRLPDGDVQAAVKDVHDAVLPYVSNTDFVPYGVTAGMLAEALANANAFQTLVGDVKTAMSLSTEANAQIEAMLAKLTANGKQFDLLMETFKTTDLAFYTGFVANNIEPNLGVRHTGLEGMVKTAATGAGIAGAQVRHTGIDRVVTADITGAYSMIKFLPGIFNFEVSAPGYVTQTVMLRIDRGRILERDFVLESA